MQDMVVLISLGCELSLLSSEERLPHQKSFFRTTHHFHVYLEPLCALLWTTYVVLPDQALGERKCCTSMLQVKTILSFGRMTSVRNHCWMTFSVRY